MSKSWNRVNSKLVNEENWYTSKTEPFFNWNYNVFEIMKTSNVFNFSVNFTIINQEFLNFKLFFKVIF